MANPQPQLPQEPAQPKANAEKPSGGATVIVGCRLPAGYMLQTYVMRDEEERVPGGGSRTVQVARKTEHSFRLNGNRVRIGQTADWIITPGQQGTGAGLTRGVPESVWEAWLKDHKNEPIVKNGVIFAHARENEVRAMAKDFRKQLTGLEPFNPKDDPRKPRAPKGETVVGELQDGNKDEEVA